MRLVFGMPKATGFLKGRLGAAHDKQVKVRQLLSFFGKNRWLTEIARRKGKLGLSAWLAALSTVSVQASILESGMAKPAKSIERQKMSNVEKSTVQGWFPETLRKIGLLLTQSLLWSCFLTVTLFPFYRLWFWLKNGFWFKYSGFDALSSLGVTVQLERITWLFGFLSSPLKLAFSCCFCRLGFSC